MNKFDQTVQNERMWLISWMIIPLFAVWFSVSYLVGEIKIPSWENPVNVRSNQNVVQPIKEFEWQGTGLVTIWFDDAYMSQFTVASPVMNSKGLVGALAVPTKMIGTPGYMNWQQVQGMSYQGWEINAHTRTHSCSLDKANIQTLEDELGGSKQDLTEHNLPTQHFVTPCGVENDLLKSVARKHFDSLRTSFPGNNPIPVQDAFGIRAYALRNTTTVDQVKQWLDESKAEKKWVILMFHQIDAENGEYTVLPQTLAQMLDVVKQSELPVVLPSQVLSIGKKDL